MSRIIQTLRKRRKFLSKIQIAYAISVCEVLLNPHNLHIQVNESVIKLFLTKNENFLSNSDRSNDDDKAEELQLQRAVESENIRVVIDDVVEKEFEAEENYATDDEERET